MIQRIDVNRGPFIPGAVSRLIELDLEASLDFERAANLLEAGSVAAYLRECGERRQGFADQLAASSGATRCRRTSSDLLLAPARHRWWLAFDRPVRGSDVAPLLDAADRGEAMVEERYESARRETESRELLAVMLHQHLAIRDDRATLRMLRIACT